MKNIDVKTVDPETLVDITQIYIDENLPKEERIKEYIRQVKNPYCYKVGDIIVKTRYSEDSGLSISDCFAQLLSCLL